MIAEPLKIEKCASCGHDIMARDDLAKHTNVKDGHRYFTQYCQECGCKSAARTPDGAELTPQINQPVKPGPGKTFTCRQCGENFTSKQMLAMHSKAKHVVPYKRVSDLLAQGMSVQDIAEEMGAPVPTVTGWVNRLNARQHGNGEKQKPHREEAAEENGSGPRPGEAEPEGILKTRIEISRRESTLVFQNAQLHFIRDYIVDLMECTPDGDSIRMEMRIFPGGIRRILIEISGQKERVSE
jgi:transposase-like protein